MNAFNGGAGIWNASATSGLSDPINDGLYQLVHASIDTGGVAWWVALYIAPISLGGSLTITLENHGGDNMAAVAFEVSGLNGVADVIVSGNTTAWGNGVEALSSGTLAQADEIVFSLITGRNDQLVTLTTPSGFTPGAVNNGSGSYTAPASGIAYKITSATTAVVGAWTSSSTPTNSYPGGGREALISFKAGIPAPYLVSVTDTTPANGASVTITAVGLHGAETVSLGGIAQTITGTTSGSVTFTVDRGTNKYGVPLALTLTNTNGTSNTINLTLEPQAGWSYINLTTPDVTASERITATGDLASGDQLAYNNQSGAITLFSDATFSAAAGASSFDVEAWTSGSGYGATSTQTLSFDVNCTLAIITVIGFTTTVPVATTVLASNAAVGIVGYSAVILTGVYSAPVVATPIISSKVPLTLVPTALEYADPLTYKHRRKQILILENTTGGSLTATIFGTEAVETYPDRLGKAIPLTAGYPITVAAGSSKAIDLESIADYFVGPTLVVGATGLTAFLIE
jgi:hypothetical protein